MKQLLLAIIFLCFVFLSAATKHKIKLANGETLQITNGRKVLSRKQNLSGTLNLVKDRNSKGFQKQEISIAQERPRLYPKWSFQKSLFRSERGLISKDKLETRGRDSGSMACFSGKVPFTSDYLHAMHHPPRNN